MLKVYDDYNISHTMVDRTARAAGCATETYVRHARRAQHDDTCTSPYALPRRPIIHRARRVFGRCTWVPMPAVGLLTALVIVTVGMTARVIFVVAMPGSQDRVRVAHPRTSFCPTLATDRWCNKSRPRCRDRSETETFQEMVCRFNCLAAYPNTLTE